MKSITEIKEQLTKITKWPWSVNKFGQVESENVYVVEEFVEDYDAAFIASAPETIDRLCKCIEKLNEIYIRDSIQSAEIADMIFNNVVKASLSGKEQE